jgi:RHS repeat-associated protein
VSTESDGKDGKVTAASGPANVTSDSGPSQTQDAAAGAGGTGTASPDEKKEDAKEKDEGDPVSVATGTVTEDTVDAALPGLVPFRFRRRYSSADCAKRTPLGRGGWSHDYHQWIEPEGDGWLLRNHDGVDLSFGAIPEDGAALHRGRRLLLRRQGPTFQLLDLASRSTRSYEPFSASGHAWLRSIADGYGNRLALHYDGPSLARITDTGGREIFFRLDDQQRIVAIDVGIVDENRAGAVARLHRVATYGYTPEGELAFAADGAGHAARYLYDGKHRITRKQLKNGFAVHYEYDPVHGRVVRTWGDGGLHRVGFIYDFDKRTTTTHSGPEPRVYHWDAKGNILKEETFDGRYAVEQTWDQDHLLLSEKNAAGEEHKYEYDARGFLTAHTDPAGNVTSFEYVDDLLRRVVRPSGNFRSYEYDGYGGLWSITLETGARHSVDRDGRGRIVSTYGPSGLVQRADYDARHCLTRVVDAAGQSTTYEHDDLGRPIGRADALGRVTSIVYNPAGWVESLTLPDSSRQAFEYDPSGRLTRLTKPGGDVTMEYVGTGSLARAVLEDGSEWRLEYDREEKPVVIRNPRGERYELKYDRAGRIVEERTFDGRVLRYGYDLADRLHRVDLPDGAFRELSYDPVGNIVQESSTHGDIEYARDPQGWLIEATLVEGPVTSRVRFERDAFGRVIAEEQDGQAIRYEHDIEGRVVARYLPSGELTRFSHDLSGRLSEIEHAGVKLAIGRDVVGREITRHLAGGPAMIASSYDLLGRLSTQEAIAPRPQAAAALSALVRRSYTFDEVGRPTRIEDGRWGATDYFYDARHNLVRAQRGRLDEAFEYDPAGTLIKAFAGLGSAGEPWSVRPGGVLVRTEHAAYEGDACHRRTRKEELVSGKPTGSITEYVWDCRDRLREARLPTGEVVRYFYDAFGRRTRKIVFPRANADPAAEPPPSRVVRYLWDGDVLAKETDSAAGERAFVHEPGTFRPILQSEQGEVFLYVLDHLGTPRELLDARGRVAWAASFAAWGRVDEVQHDPETPRARPVASPFRLLGQYADDETGLHYTRFRYWDPDVAGWLSPDPLGLWGGRRLLSFDGAPTLYSDPLGLTEEAPQVLNIGAGPNPMPGATNIDLNPGHPSVQKMDANAMTFPSNHFDQVHAINPYGFNPVSDEVARVMKPGAELTISVNAEKNPFTPGKKKAPVSSDLEQVSGPSPLTDEHKFAKMKRADGGDVNEDAVKTFVFRKKKPGEAKSAEKKGKT